MDVTQELRYKVLVERKGYAFFVELDYENRPDYCTNCMKIGHHLEICRFLKKTDVQVEKAGDKVTNKTDKQVYVQTRDGKTGQGKNVTDPIIVDNLRNEEKRNHQSNSPVIAGTSKGGLNQNNRFEVLQNKEMETLQAMENERNEQDARLDQEVNNELALQQAVPNLTTEHAENDDADEFSSHDSEFVDATQINSPVAAADGSDNELNREDINALDRQNKQFVDQSWANMAEEEEAEQRLLRHIEDEQEMPTNADDFQLVTKKKGKSHKQSSTVRLNYQTRAKASHPKPFR